MDEIEYNSPSFWHISKWAKRYMKTSSYNHAILSRNYKSLILQEEMGDLHLAAFNTASRRKVLLALDNRSERQIKKIIAEEFEINSGFKGMGMQLTEFDFDLLRKADKPQVQAANTIN